MKIYALPDRGQIADAELLADIYRDIVAYDEALGRDPVNDDIVLAVNKCGTAIFVVTWDNAGAHVNHQDRNTTGIKATVRLFANGDHAISWDYQPAIAAA